MTQRFYLTLWAREELQHLAEILSKKLFHEGCIWALRSAKSNYLYGFVEGSCITKEKLLRRVLPLVRYYGCAIYVLSAMECRQIRYAVCDLDGTILAGELLARLAEGMPYQEEMSLAIEQSMAGQVDFATSFRQRTQLLVGQSRDRLYDILGATPYALGLEMLLAQWKIEGVGYALATSNYHVFAEQVATKFDFDAYIATRVELIDNRLTGQLIGKPIDAEAKDRFLCHCLESHSLDEANVLCIGDGANDLAMLARSAHSLLYCANPSAGDSLALDSIYEDIKQIVKNIIDNQLINTTENEISNCRAREYRMGI